MKRTIVASILGIAGSVAMVSTSHAQGSVYFQNYATVAANGVNIDAPITFASSGHVVLGGTGTVNEAVTAGWGVGSEFTADLLYSVGNTGTYTALTFANSGASAGQENQPFGYPATFTFGATSSGPVDHTTTYAGYFYGTGVKIPTYTSGTIAFIVEAYNGSSYASSVGAGLWRGQSAPDVLGSIATGTTPPGFLTGLQAFTVSSVPEPTTIALAGLGLAALMAFRRKQV